MLQLRPGTARKIIFLKKKERKKCTTQPFRRAGPVNFSLGFVDLSRIREWQPTPILLHGKSHGQRRLVGYTGSQKSRIRLSG